MQLLCFQLREINWDTKYITTTIQSKRGVSWPFQLKSDDTSQSCNAQYKATRVFSLLLFCFLQNKTNSVFVTPILSSSSSPSLLPSSDSALPLLRCRLLLQSLAVVELWCNLLLPHSSVFLLNKETHKGLKSLFISHFSCFFRFFFCFILWQASQYLICTCWTFYLTGILLSSLLLRVYSFILLHVL